MITVIDNFLPEIIYQELYGMVTSINFSWNCVPTNSKENYFSFEKQVDGNEDSKFTELSEIVAMYVAEKINHPTNLDSLMRIRYALIHREKTKKINAAHKDNENPHIAALFYINDSDGDTYFYKEDAKTVIKQISPKANRLAIFDGNLYHSSSTPVDNQLRYAINFNFGV
jgi:hypothetical protein